MKITVNGQEYTDGFTPDGQPKALENKPRLRWSDIGRLAGLRRDQITSKMDITVTLPGEKPKAHVHGWILIVVDGMQITARATA